MTSNKDSRKYDHSGSSFESFLQEEGILPEVEEVAVKRVLAWQLSQEMRRQSKTKQAMARELHTSRAQLDRLLDPQNISVSLAALAKAANALGKSLVIRIGNRPAGQRGRRRTPVPSPFPKTPATAARRKP